MVRLAIKAHLVEFCGPQPLCDFLKTSTQKQKYKPLCLKLRPTKPKRLNVARMMSGSPGKHAKPPGIKAALGCVG